MCSIFAALFFAYTYMQQLSALLTEAAVFILFWQRC